MLKNVYFGKPCGLMDQCACAVGGLISIDFKDTEHPVVNHVDVDFSKYMIIVYVSLIQREAMQT